MEENNKIILESTHQNSKGQVVEFDKKFAEFSPDIVGEGNEGEALPVDIEVSVLYQIKKFLEDHDYDPAQVVITKPLKSDKLEDHLDQKSYEMFKQYFGPENADKIKPLVDAAYFLNMDKFKQACLITLGCPFYVGTSDHDKLTYKEKWGIGDLTPEEEREIIDNNKPVFDQINSLFEQRMEEEQKKYDEEQRKAQDQQNQ